jgi:hypothetical protein
MRERVLLVGGEFHLKSEKGKGTRKQIRLPVREKNLMITWANAAKALFSAKSLRLFNVRHGRRLSLMAR